MIELLLDLYKEKFGKNPSINIIAGKDATLGLLCLNALKKGKEITDKDYQEAYKDFDIDLSDKDGRKYLITEEELEKQTREYLQSLLEKEENENKQQASKLFDVDL